MRFRYLTDKTGHPVITLGGRMGRPHPIVPVGLVGPLRTEGRDAAVDSMADDTVFPMAVAQAVGIDLSQAPAGYARGIGGIRFAVQYAQVNLRLTDGIEFREWPAWVGFTNAKMSRPLLGFAGCLQFFTAVFHGDLEELELKINSLYPGI
jgi:hypothetical protein